MFKFKMDFFVCWGCIYKFFCIRVGLFSVHSVYKGNVVIQRATVPLLFALETNNH